MTNVFRTGAIVALIVVFGGVANWLTRPRGNGWRPYPWTWKWTAATTAVVATGAAVTVVAAHDNTLAVALDLALVSAVGTAAAVGVPYRFWVRKNDRATLAAVHKITAPRPVITRVRSNIGVGVTFPERTFAYHSHTGWVWFDHADPTAPQAPATRDDLKWLGV